MSWVLDVWVLDVLGAGCPGCWMSWVLDVRVLDVPVLDVWVLDVREPLKGVLCEDYLINQAGHPMLGGSNFCKKISCEHLHLLSKEMTVK